MKPKDVVRLGDPMIFWMAGVDAPFPAFVQQQRRTQFARHLLPIPEQLPTIARLYS